MLYKVHMRLLHWKTCLFKNVLEVALSSKMKRKQVKLHFRLEFFSPPPSKSITIFVYKTETF